MFSDSVTKIEILKLFYIYYHNCLIGIFIFVEPNNKIKRGKHFVQIINNIFITFYLPSFVQSGD